MLALTPDSESEPDPEAEDEDENEGDEENDVGPELANPEPGVEYDDELDKNGATPSSVEGSCSHVQM